MTGFSDLTAAAESLLARYREAGLTVATAESCTGGLIAGALTAIAGSSAVVERGFVTYSNKAKVELLGVTDWMIEQNGAVSEAVARAMAEGALKRSRADVAVSVTGIAGPGGGSADKPVGLVHLAAAAKGARTLHRECRFGEIGRDEVRFLSVLRAFELAAEMSDQLWRRVV